MKQKQNDFSRAYLWLLPYKLWMVTANKKYKTTKYESECSWF